MDREQIKSEIEELTSLLKTAVFFELDSMTTACTGGTVGGVTYGRDPILDMTHADLWRDCELSEGPAKDKDKPLETRFSKPTDELIQFREAIDTAKGVEEIHEAICALVYILGKCHIAEENAKKVLNAIRAIAKSFDLCY